MVGVTAICGLLCDSCQVALGGAWAAAELDLQLIPSYVPLGLVSQWPPSK